MDDENTLKDLKIDDRKLRKALETLRAREKQIEEAPSWQHYADDIKIDKSSIMRMILRSIRAVLFRWGSIKRMTKEATGKLSTFSTK